MPARTLNLILAIWLFVSAFAWPHSTASFTNTWIVGLLAAIFALIGMKNPGARYVNTALSAWLFISAFVLPHVSAGTVWNNALVAIAMFIISLVPGTMMPPLQRRRVTA